MCAVAAAAVVALVEDGQAKMGACYSHVHFFVLILF